jgi:hypothetical protein
MSASITSGRTGARRISPRTRKALVALAASAAFFPLAATGSAQAGQGNYCGNGTTTIALSTGQSCINPYYHTDYRTLVSNRHSGSGTHCAGVSTSPTALNVAPNYGCTSNTSAVWQGSAPGYAALWVAGGSGQFYGFFVYA